MQHDTKLGIWYHNDSISFVFTIPPSGMKQCLSAVVQLPDTCCQPDASVHAGLSPLEVLSSTIVTCIQQQLLLYLCSEEGMLGRERGVWGAARSAAPLSYIQHGRAPQDLSEHAPNVLALEGI